VELICSWFIGGLQVPTGSNNNFRGGVQCKFTVSFVYLFFNKKKYTRRVLGGYFININFVVRPTKFFHRRKFLKKLG
jgi:hypothetical protein